MRTIVAGLALAAASACASAATSSSMQATPAGAAAQRPTLPIITIELDKTRFLQTERVFLWTDVQRAPGDERPISPALLDDVRVVYTRPDGTTRVDRVGAATDGFGINRPGDMGYRGGWTLGDTPPQVGRWSVVFEMGPLRSAPAVFTIEAPPALSDIETRFEFATPSLANVNATLLVRNGTPEVLRFVEPGQNLATVWARVTGAGVNASFSVPPDVLATATGNKQLPMMFERLDWDSVQRFPCVTLAPGATWRVTIPMNPWAAGHLRVSGAELSLNTELQLVIGEPTGEWRGFSPLRVIASGTTRLR